MGVYLTRFTLQTIIELNSELLIDRSRIRDPYLRLLLTVIGEELAQGSAWVAVTKGPYSAGMQWGRPRALAGMGEFTSCAKRSISWSP